MPAKKGKRTAAKVPSEVEENESNVGDQIVEQAPAKKKGRGPKAKAVTEQAEAPEKKPVKGKSNKTGPETSDENEGPLKKENGGEAKTVSKRGQASKNTGSEKPKDKGNEVQESQRRGASRAAKKGTSMAEETDVREHKSDKAKGRKAGIKNVNNEDAEKVDAEPPIKKSRGRPKTEEDSNETKQKRKGRLPKGASKSKEVDEKGDSGAENGESADETDNTIDIDGKQLRVAVEH